MHELSLTEALVRVLEEQASVQGYRVVRHVRVELGALSCVEPEAIAFCFEIVAKDTVADGASLSILRFPGSAECRNCGLVQEIAALPAQCSTCQSTVLRVLSGTEFRIKDMEVE